ncbi:AMP-dependent synthetase and ligase family protein [Striga asiatica]|uniref:AMP-dependent synthetase and ligase family protein n=1 Tax=Striga asiatica TaxID=4170 RepID=A0A5A7P787_STRAF|nr:AMP-dependent synthetase and ligase family protein [Striga asiatica]
MSSCRLAEGTTTTSVSFKWEPFVVLKFLEDGATILGRCGTSGHNRLSMRCLTNHHDRSFSLFDEPSKPLPLEAKLILAITNTSLNKARFECEMGHLPRFRSPPFCVCLDCQLFCRNSSIP